MKKLILLTLISGCTLFRYNAAATNAPPASAEPGPVVCRFKQDKISERGPDYLNLSCPDYWKAVESSAEQNGNTSILFCYVLDQACGLPAKP